MEQFEACSNYDSMKHINACPQSMNERERERERDQLRENQRRRHREREQKEEGKQGGSGTDTSRHYGKQEKLCN